MRAGRWQRWFDLARPGWLLLLALAALPVGAQTGKVGYLDMQRLLDNAPQVVAARKQLESEFRAQDAQLKQEEARLAALKERESREAGMLPKAAADSLRREIAALDRSIQRTRKKSSDELKARADEEIARHWPAINDAVIAYAREQGYDLVLRSPIPYANPRIDITDAVLERLRAQAAKKPAP